MNEFKKVMLVVMSILGVSSFAKDEKGKSLLTDDQKKNLSEKFGNEFVSKFESELVKMEANGESPETVAKSDEVVKALEAEKKTLSEQINAQKTRIEKLEAEKKNFAEQIAKLEKEPGETTGQEIKGDGEMKKAFKPDMSLSHNKTLLDIMQGKPGAAYSGDSTIDTTELKKEFGKYVSSEKTEIIQSLFGATESVKEMTTILTDKTEVRATHGIITSVLQQFTPQFTAKGTGKFTPLVIRNYKHKINVPIIPSDVMTDILGYMYDEKQTTLENMFIVKYIVENMIKPKLDEERETAITIGRFVEAVADASGNYKATPATDSMTGYLTQLVDLYNAANTDVNYLQKAFAITDATTDEQIRESIDKAVQEVTPLYKRKALKVYCDPDLITRYQKAYREKYPNTKNQDGEVIKIDFTKFSLCPMEGMRGSNCYFITPAENFKHLLSRDPSNISFRFYDKEYTTEVLAEWWEATGFWLAEALFIHIDPAFATAHKATTTSEAGA